MAMLLKGADAARALTEQLREQAEELKKNGTEPCLAILRVGAREDDLSYERGVMTRCGKVGVAVRQFVARAMVQNIPQKYKALRRLIFQAGQQFFCIQRRAVDIACKHQLHGNSPLLSFPYPCAGRGSRPLHMDTISNRHRFFNKTPPAPCRAGGLHTMPHTARHISQIPG